MTDTELADYLGLQGYSDQVRAKFIKALPPEKRAMYDKMKTTEEDIKLWQAGVGPKPENVILCFDRSTNDRGGKSSV